MTSNNIQRIKGLCDDLARRNRIILSYAKRLDSLNKSLTDLLDMVESGNLEVLDIVDSNILEKALDLSTDAKYAVSSALDEMEYIEREVGAFVE